MTQQQTQLELISNANPSDSRASSLDTVKPSWVGIPMLAGVAMSAAPMAQAATFTVINTNDAGAGSLRQAITDANGAAGADTVVFSGAGASGTITLTTGQLSITDSVTITGPGAASLTVNGNNASRVFYLYNGSATIDVTISGLTIRGGNASIGAGIVDFDENLTIDDCVITGNAATGDGGGLWADGFNMTLTITDTTISGNTSGDDGGGIYVEDTGGLLTISNSRITGNTATGSGGGVYFYDPDNDTLITNTTISGNSSSKGGGHYLYSPDAGSHTISATTVSGNTSTNSGGGVYLYGPDEPTLIVNTTISGNTATNGSGGGIVLYNNYEVTLRHLTISNNTAGAADGGGGLVSISTVDIEKSIIANNTANGVANDTSTSFGGQPPLPRSPQGLQTLNLTNTLVETPGTAAINDLGGNLLNQDPALGALANNGGPTFTHLPATGSPVINAGGATAETVDQRGTVRPQGPSVDMGAVEAVLGTPGAVQFTITAVTINEGAGTVTLTVSRTGGSLGAISVGFATANGTATGGADYTALAGTLNWADGDTANKTIVISITEDTLVEIDETFTVTLSNPTGGATVGAAGVATVTIGNNDFPIVPSLTQWAQILMAGMLAVLAWFGLRRNKVSRVIPAALLAAVMGLGGAPDATAQSSTGNRSKQVQTGTLVAPVARSSSAVTLQLSGAAAAVSLPLDKFEFKDKRNNHKQRVNSVTALAANQFVQVKVVRDAQGNIIKAKLIALDANSPDARKTR